MSKRVQCEHDQTVRKGEGIVKKYITTTWQQSAAAPALRSGVPSEPSEGGWSEHATSGGAGRPGSGPSFLRWREDTGRSDGVSGFILGEAGRKLNGRNLK